MGSLWPILMIVTANTMYNICAKQTPEDANPFLSLVITYGVAMTVSLGLFYCTSEDRSISHAFSRINWSSYAFGLSIVALEFGYLNVYRLGWEIHTASVTANISLAVILVLVGALLYREVITLRQIAGMAVCAAGLILLSRP